MNDITRQANHDSQQPKPNNGMVKDIIRANIFIVVAAAALFLSAGSIVWLTAWVFLAVSTINVLVMTGLLDRDLIAERARMGEGAKKWDIVLVLLMARIGPLIMLVIAGLDRRFGWTARFPLWVTVCSLLVLLLALVITDWAMLTNRFFSGVVRIQKDRGHRVIDTGPYRFVRHPGYVGANLFCLAAPLLLDSLWALIPAIITIVVTFVRTYLEDRTLQRELDGYADYAHRVRYRLVPGLW